MSYVYGEVKDPMKFISDLQKCDFVCFLNILESDSTIGLILCIRKISIVALSINLLCIFLFI